MADWVYEDEDCDQFEEIENKNENKETKIAIRDCINTFFEGKQMFTGGKIPERILMSDKYVDLVISLFENDGVEMAYQMMGTGIDIVDDAEESGCGQDVMLLVNLIHECGRKNIPRPFVAGLILMHLELCEGIELPGEETNILGSSL